MAEDKTVKEALISVALEEIDELTHKLDTIAGAINETANMLPAYFEEASNEVSNIIKRGVTADIELAKNDLTSIYKQVHDTIEIQRRLNSQLKAIAADIDTKNSKRQSLIVAVSAFLGAFIAVLLASLI